MKERSDRHKPFRSMLELERQLWRTYRHIAGTDEAGRGPLAGPVVAAAVLFEPETLKQPPPVLIQDSKSLSESQRMEACEWILQHAVSVGVASVEPADIDAMNIRNAAMLAMEQAVAELDPQPDIVLVDGHDIAALTLPQKAVVQGDRLCFSIAAASIVAKVRRDAVMTAWHQTYPQYGFDRHKGYPTPEHIEAIKKYGLCPLHRKSFRVRKLQELGFYDEER